MKQEKLLIEDAIERVRSRFPFAGYIPERGGGHANIAGCVLKLLKPGASILDFGSGPCDKTAVLQMLGYSCTAYDDLADDWHLLDENREKVIQWANDCGIRFKLAGRNGLPFEKESFDMVMAHDVLEHLHDSPRDLLNDLLELAKPNGYLFVTVPNAVNIRKRLAVLRGKTNLPSYPGFYWYPGRWRGHVREYVKDDLRQMASYLDLETVMLDSCDHMLQKVPKGVLPAYLIVTKLWKGWKDSWLFVGKKKVGWRPKRELPRTELEAILAESSTYKYAGEI